MQDKEKVGKELSRIAKFVDERLYELRGVRNQREIADIAGYANQNMITMIKQGHTKVAIDRVAGLAKALDADLGKLMRMALEQSFTPDAIRDLEMALGVTRNEKRLLDVVREASKESDPLITEDIEAKIRAIFA